MWQTDPPININNRVSQDICLTAVIVHVGQTACFCPEGEAFLLLVCLGVPSCLNERHIPESGGQGAARASGLPVLRAGLSGRLLYKTVTLIS